jgi:hypothetical protein
LESEEAVLDLSRPKIMRGLLAGVVTVRLDSRVHVPRPLPPAVLAALRRLATFPNPRGIPGDGISDDDGRGAGSYRCVRY